MTPKEKVNEETIDQSVTDHGSQGLKNEPQSVAIFSVLHEREFLVGYNVLGGWAAVEPHVSLVDAKLYFLGI